jgi:hypothetical protein
MILQCNYAGEGCGLPGGEGTIGKECGEAAESIAGSSSPLKGAVFGKGKWVISTVSKQYENDAKMTSLTRRRSGLWNHPNRSYGCGVTRC